MTGEQRCRVQATFAAFGCGQAAGTGRMTMGGGGGLAAGGCWALRGVLGGAAVVRGRPGVAGGVRLRSAAAVCGIQHGRAQHQQAESQQAEAAGVMGGKHSVMCGKEDPGPQGAGCSSSVRWKYISTYGDWQRDLLRCRDEFGEPPGWLMAAVSPNPPAFFLAGRDTGAFCRISRYI